MKHFLRLLFTCLLAALSLSAGAHAQEATLVVHNNTNATLEVFTQNAFSSGTQSETVVLQPNSRGQLRVPMGQSVILAEAIHMQATPDATWTYNFNHSGMHELEIFPADFQLSAMFDRPSATPQAASAGPPEPTPEERRLIEALGIREEPPRESTCRAPRVNPTYFLVDYVSSCPEGYITRGRVPPGGTDARWCAYCGAGYHSQLDRGRCCVPVPPNEN